MTLPEYEAGSFTWNQKTRPVYRRGRGPGVIILHELPGLTPQTAALGERVAAAGFTAVLPVLFGTPGRPLSAGYFWAETVRLCLSREIACLASAHASPIADWLRRLCGQVHQECGGSGVGVLGMCVTGGFALSACLEPAVLAPVVCQPSRPFLAWTEARREALGIAPAEMQAIRTRCAGGLQVLGLRFSHDAQCPAERFRRLRRELGNGFQTIELDSSPGNGWVPPDAHAVLTMSFVDEDGHPTRQALAEVIDWFRKRLGP